MHAKIHIWWLGTTVELVLSVIWIPDSKFRSPSWFISVAPNASYFKDI